MVHNVFISHSSKDRHIAEMTCRYLEQRNIHCWMAPRDVPPGEDWAESIVSAIVDSKLILLIFSSHSNESAQINREINIAADEGIPILPFRIEAVQPLKRLRYYLSTPHWLDAVSPPVEKHFDDLVKSVKMRLPATLDSNFVKSARSAESRQDQRPNTSPSLPKLPIESRQNQQPDISHSPSKLPIASRQNPQPNISHSPPKLHDQRTSPYSSRQKVVAGLGIASFLFIALVIWIGSLTSTTSANLSYLKTSTDKEGKTGATSFKTGDTLYAKAQVSNNRGKVKVKFYLLADDVKGMTKGDTLKGSEVTVDIEGDLVASYTVPVSDGFLAGSYKLNADMLNVGGEKKDSKSLNITVTQTASATRP